jgi:hypothetical protein
MDRYLFLIVLLILLGCEQQTNQKSRNDLVVNKAGINSEIKTFELLLDNSRIEKKNLFLVFTFQGCSICRIFDKYHNDSIVKGILSHYFIIKKIDYYKTPGGKELYSSYGKVGFPSRTIIDSTKHVIIDSGNLKDRKGNIGFPSSKIDREYYIMAVKKAAPSITKQEREILIKKLKEYRPDRVE